MASRLRLALLLSACLCAAVASARPHLESAIRLPSERASAAEGESDDSAVGTRWAVLIAGSNGYYNYRHQVRVLRIDRTISFPSRVIRLELFTHGRRGTRYR